MLLKSRRRDPHALDFGRYMLMTMETNLVRLGSEPNAFSATLDDVEAYLTRSAEATGVSLTAAEAMDLSKRTELAREAGSMLDVVMPNGKKLRECTFAYVAEVGKALEGWGIALEGWDTQGQLGRA